MMNVVEARRLTKEYFAKETSRYLELIEDYIRQVAGKGAWRCLYTKDIAAARDEVQDAIINTLLENGYEAELVDNNSGIRICWSES